MKQKLFRGLKFLLLIILILSGSLFLVIRFGLFERYNYFTSKWDIHTNQMVYLRPGGEDGFRNQDLVAGKYGLKIDYTNEDCSGTESEFNGAKIYREVISGHLKEKLGKNWEDQFWDELRIADTTKIELND